MSDASTATQHNRLCPDKHGPTPCECQSWPVAPTTGHDGQDGFPPSGNGSSGATS